MQHIERQESCTHIMYSERTHASARCLYKIWPATTCYHQKYVHIQLTNSYNKVKGCPLLLHRPTCMDSFEYCLPTQLCTEIPAWMQYMAQTFALSYTPHFLLTQPKLIHIYVLNLWIFITGKRKMREFIVVYTCPFKMRKSAGIEGEARKCWTGEPVAYFACIVGDNYVRCFPPGTYKVCSTRTFFSISERIEISQVHPSVTQMIRIWLIHLMKLFCSAFWIIKRILHTIATCFGMSIGTFVTN